MRERSDPGGATGPHRPPRAVFDACRRALVQMGAEQNRSLAVTSSIRGEGRTSVALALAVAQATDYRRSVLLLDLDVSRPTLSHHLRLRRAAGITDVIRGDCDLDEVVQPVDDGVFAIPAGRHADDEPDGFSSGFARMGPIHQLKSRFDGLVADLPPILESSDALMFARAFEQVLLVVRASATSTALVQEAADALPSRPLAILNDTHSKLPSWIRRLGAR